MPTYEPVRFAMVSPARWGRLLLDSVRESDKLELTGVFSRNQANAQAVADEYGGRTFSSYEALLDDDSIEAVMLPTPHFLHHPQTMAALQAGKHVFVEKPMANTLDEAREMQQLAQEKGLVLAVGLQGRRGGGILKAKAMIDNGELGQVVMAVGTHGAPLAMNYTEADWETSAEKIPGGPLDNLGVHYADVLEFLLGPVKRVSGFYTNKITPFDVIDAGTANFEFESGAVGVYTVQQVSAYVSQLSLYGTKGALHLKRFGQELEWQDLVDTQAAKREGPTLRNIEFDGPNPFTTGLQEELEDLADCIRLGGQPKVGAAEGIASLRLIRAIMESNDTGKAVMLS
ncbi:MAG: hypothetical protein CL610_08265 [Anaerolineaceae bacterium]|nr:hypothetical protein [Anaerolineaceae bacterium]